MSKCCRCGNELTTTDGFGSFGNSSLCSKCENELYMQQEAHDEEK